MKKREVSLSFLSRINTLLISKLEVNLDVSTEYHEIGSGKAW